VLSKKVCRMCVAEMAGKPVMFSPHDTAAAKWRGWDEDDDRRWKSGIVACRRWPSEVPPKRKGKPPRWCRYALEHAVSEKP
jgi:hypothetical protein